MQIDISIEIVIEADVLSYDEIGDKFVYLSVYDKVQKKEILHELDQAATDFILSHVEHESELVNSAAEEVASAEYEKYKRGA